MNSYYQHIMSGSMYRGEPREPLALLSHFKNTASVLVCIVLLSNEFSENGQERSYETLNSLNCEWKPPLTHTPMKDLEVERRLMGESAQI